MSYEEAKAYADECGLLFMETSAKTAANVMDIFTSIAKKLPKGGDGGADGAAGRTSAAGGRSQGAVNVAANTSNAGAQPSSCACK